MSAYQLVDAATCGELALPVFQRAPVWSRDQQALLLDSLVRGWPCGALLLWHPPRETSSVPLHGCPAFAEGLSSFLVLDGQQRLTALIAAARGELEVRWDGVRWGATGYLEAQMCFQEYAGNDSCGEHLISLKAHAGPEVWEAALRAWENVHRAQIQAIIVEGDEPTARDTYRRFNSSGTAHNIDEC